MSKVRFDDNLLHGRTETLDPKVVQLRRENLEADFPTRPFAILCWLDVGVYAALLRCLS